MDSVKGFSISALTEKNYPTWKVQIKMQLKRDDLFNIVNGTETPPANDADANVLSKYNLRRDRALATIVLAIDPKLLYLLGDPSDPAVVWTTLQNVFMKKTWSNKLRLKKKLYNLKLIPGGNLQEHLKEFVELFGELAVIDSALEEEDRVITLLASLPDNFSTIVTTLEALDAVPTWDVVTERLLHEDAKMQGNFNVSENQALVSSKPVYKKKVIVCHFCNKSGHIKKNCFSFKRKMKNNDINSGRANPSIVNTVEGNVTLFASALSSVESNSSWIIDSGASQHMSNNVSSFFELTDLSSPIAIKIGSGETLQAVAVGKISLKLRLPDDKINDCTLLNVLYVPKLAYNLLSVSQAASTGKCTSFYETDCKIYCKNLIVATGSKIGKLYVLNCSVNETVTANYSSAVSDSETLWHRRFCHLGINNLRKLFSNNLVIGPKCNVSDKKFFCEPCCHGKNHKTPFDCSAEKTVRQPFDLIHSDVCGKIDPVSQGGGNYFVTFIDDSTRYLWVYIMKNKSDVFQIFKDWSIMIQKQYDCKIKRFRTDNGGEYTSNEFEMYLKKEGIVHEKTIPYTPEQNGLAERMNRTLIETIRTMLADSNVSKSLWAEAISTASYVRNRSPASALDNMTPYEALNKRKPNVKHLRVFGSTGYVHVPKEARSKLDSTSLKCVFVGYGTITKGYRMYNPISSKILFSRNVIFNEKQSVENEEKQAALQPVLYYDDNDKSDEDDNFSHNVVTSQRKSMRRINPPNRFGEWVCSSVVDIPEPKTVSEALNGPESNEWKLAMQREIDSIDSNNVWTLTKSSNGKAPITTKWIFKRKIGSDGNVSSYKARLVAQGFSQRPGVDYEETFAPVIRFESVRTIIALSAKHNMKIHQMDVSSAFLNGNIEEELYLTQPEGFIQSGKENFLCKLNKAIYGLKQAPKCWNSCIDSFLKELKFEQSSNDSCIYTKTIDNKHCILGIYVDDVIIASESIDYINDIKTSLNSRFKMKDLGSLNYFLGVNIDTRNEGIFLHQSSCISSMLTKFGFDNCKSVSTPTDVSCPLDKTNDNDELFDNETYQSAVGTLLYLSIRTRPDINFAVSNVAKFSSCPSSKHWVAVKRIFRYLKGTDSFGLFYSRHHNNEFVGYSDSDWAGDKTDRKSTSGYCFKIGDSLISWRSNKQTCVALSTAEAEYVALAAASQEAIWLNELFRDMNFEYDSPMTIYEDNQSAIALANNPRNHPKTKHIDIKYHFIRDLVKQSRIKIEYCPTELMLADIFTKPITTDKFIKLRNMIGMFCCQI